MIIRLMKRKKNIGMQINFSKIKRDFWNRKGRKSNN